NGTPNLFPVGSNMQIINDNLKNLKKSSQTEDVVIELKVQGLIDYEANNYESSIDLSSKLLSIDPN
ncbi:22190_t:CDS:1, partial [Racocetra persica]